MFKKLVAMAAAVVCVSFTAGCVSAEAADDMSVRWSGDTVKVGFLANLTGPGAYTDIPPKMANED